MTLGNYYIKHDTVKWRHKTWHWNDYIKHETVKWIHKTCHKAFFPTCYKDNGTLLGPLYFLQYSLTWQRGTAEYGKPIGSNSSCVLSLPIQLQLSCKVLPCGSWIILSAEKSNMSAFWRFFARFWKPPQQTHVNFIAHPLKTNTGIIFITHKNKHRYNIYHT